MLTLAKTKTGFFEDGSKARKQSVKKRKFAGNQRKRQATPTGRLRAARRSTLPPHG